MRALAACPSSLHVLQRRCLLGSSSVSMSNSFWYARTRRYSGLEYLCSADRIILRRVDEAVDDRAHRLS